MSDQIKNKRINRKMYFWNLIIIFPAFVIAREFTNTFIDTGYAETGIPGISMLLAFLYVFLIFRWTTRRLHDIGKSGWFSLFLIPPFTIPLWIYLFAKESNTKPNKYGNSAMPINFLGVRARGFINWAVIVFILLGIVLSSALFAGLYMDNLNESYLY